MAVKLTIEPVARRLIVIMLSLVILCGVAVFLILHRSARPPPASVVAPTPRVNSVPGGDNNSQRLQSLKQEKENRDNLAASKAGAGYAAPVDGASEVGDPSMAKPAGLTVEAGEAGADKPAPAPAVVGNPFAQDDRASSAAAPASAPASAQANSRPPPAAGPHASASVVLELTTAWSGRAPAIELGSSSSGGGDASGETARLAGATSENAVSNAGGGGHGLAEPASQGDTMAKKLPTKTLISAGTGIYVRNILAVSSDQGGPVVVEAESGPIAGLRMTGAFETKDERLVVKLSSLTMADGTQTSIDAIAVAPDTMETSVASNVDEHYMARFVLPAAAAFVQGLGQAFQQSNSTSVAGPLGSVTTVGRLNLPQQLGVAAGSAGQQIGQVLAKAAPDGPTVTLDKDVNLGVVFLKSVSVPE